MADPDITQPHLEITREETHYGETVSAGPGLTRATRRSSQPRSRAT